MRRDKAQRAEKRFRKFGKSDPDETGIADPNQSRISDPNGPESVIPLGRNMQFSTINANRAKKFTISQNITVFISDFSK